MVKAVFNGNLVLLYNKLPLLNLICAATQQSQNGNNEIKKDN